MFIWVLVLVLVLCGVLSYIKWKQTYWQRKGVACVAAPFFFGDIKPLVKRQMSFGDVVLNTYRKLKPLGQIHGGMYLFFEPVYVPLDPKLIKQITTKDFHHFRSHGSYYHRKDVLTMNLFGVEGDYWKDLRIKLTPTFTSGKMKMMFETVQEKTLFMEELVLKFAQSQEPFAVKDIVARFTTDVIGSCAFGIECNSLKEPENDFRTYGAKVLVHSGLTSALITTFPWEFLGNTGFLYYGSEVTSFFTNMVKDTVKMRLESKIIRKDFMHLLLELLMNNANAGQECTKSLTEDEIIAQCFIFFLAGFETSSSTMTFVLLCLAQNQEIQNKLRQELNDVLNKFDGKITYEAMLEMNYLDKVINETLRRYPPVTVLPRRCTETYKVPNTDVVIQEGVRVLIPVWGLHMDPEYFPNPEVFDPERFSPQSKSAREDFTYLPFGEGPRMCIGLRFGLMQTKIGLISLIRNFQFFLNEKTLLPIEMSPADLVLSVKGELWLNAKKLQ